MNGITTVLLEQNVKGSAGLGLAYGWLNSGNVLPDNFIYAFVYVDEYNGFYEIRARP